MSPRPKNPENKGLPARWRFRHGAYQYQVPKGLEHLWDGKTEFRLGATLTEAGPVWASRVQPVREVKTVGQLLDAFYAQYVPTLAPKTQASYREAIHAENGGLKVVFGHMGLLDPQPHHIYAYVDAHGSRLTLAHRRVEVLGSAYTWGISKGWTSYHPIKGKVRLKNPPRRERYVEDAELLIYKSTCTPVMFAYVWLRELTADRRYDLLSLNPGRDFKPDGIYVQPHKTAKTTGKRIIHIWTPQLRLAVDCALAARPKDIAPTLFCTRKGDPYIKADGSANGWDSLWQRDMARALKAGLTHSFTDRDIRKKVATDAPTLERAAQLLGHADPRTTQRHYRIGAERVKPTR